MMTDDRPNQNPEQQHSQQFHVPPQQVNLNALKILNGSKMTPISLIKYFYKSKLLTWFILN